MSAVSLRAVRKSFGSTEVVHGVDISIADGEFCVLVGPSGCGKSTLLRMIAGLEEISSGEIAIGARVVNALRPKERDIAMVFQNYALYPHMTVYDNMAFSLRLAGVAKDEAGQRVAVGRAIVRKPQVFLFDEPLSNLDAKLRVAMRTEIKALHQRLTTTSVYVTHDQIEAMTMADKIVVMNNGRVEQIGSPLELYDNPANLFVAGFIGSPAMNFLKGRLNGAAVAVGEEISFPVSTKLESGRDVLVGVRPEHLAVSSDGVPAEVVVVEPTGADTQIFCKLAGTDVTAVVRERHDFRPGESIRLKPQLTYLFDPSSGARLA